jgi:hypothetical protein
MSEQIPQALCELFVCFLQRAFQEVAVIPPEESSGHRAIGALTSTLMSPAVALDGEFQAMRTAARWPGFKLEPPAAGEIPRGEALAHCRRKIVVVGTGQTGAQFGSMPTVKQADGKSCRQIGFPGRLKTRAVHDFGKSG